MSVEDVEQTLRMVDDETAALLRTAAALSDTQCRAPSGLIGWTRGHLLTHLARNADALVNLMTGSRTGNPLPMYPSPDARDDDIEAGAGRTAAELVDDLRESAARFQEATEALGSADEHWRAVVEWRKGRRRPLSDVPRARLTEIGLHHADLDVDRGLGDLPDPVADAIIAECHARARGLPDVPVFEVRATDGQATSQTSAESAQVTVAGPRAALLGWLSGRTDGSGLTTAGALPELPPWS